MTVTVLPHVEDPEAKRERHILVALRALIQARGNISLAADISTLPARFIAREARWAGITADEPADTDWVAESHWEATVLRPARVHRRPARIRAAWVAPIQAAA